VLLQEHRLGDLVLVQWLAVGLVAVVTVTRIVVNLRNRPTVEPERGMGARGD
jgi:hypothetical protein